MDPARLKADASAALAAGQFARAGSLYAAYCASAPRDRQSHLRMGDAWARAGDRPRAIDAYLAAAQGFADDGFLARAIAASKLVLELDPKHPRVQGPPPALHPRRAAGGQALRAMLAGAAPASSPPATTGAGAPGSEAEPARGASQDQPGASGSHLPAVPDAAARPPEPLAEESPAVLSHGSEPSSRAAVISGGAPAPELVDLVVTEYMLEPDPTEHTLEDVLSGEAEREARAAASPQTHPAPLELDAPMLPPSPEAGPRFLELSLEDAPGTAEAGPMLAPANAPAELPILGVESVLLADSAGAGELGSPADVASPDSPGNPPYIDLFADEGEPATSPPAGEDSRADEAHGSPGQLGQLAGPDEELPPAEAGPLLLALEELAEHPPPEVFHP